MLGPHVTIGQVGVVSRHHEASVPELLLQAEHVPSVPEVHNTAGVAELMGIAPF